MITGLLGSTEEDLMVTHTLSPLVCLGYPPPINTNYAAMYTTAEINTLNSTLPFRRQ